MAFMNQEKKALIAAELKKVVPADWKWTLKVEHHSTLILTIRSAPVDLIEAYNKHREGAEHHIPAKGYVQLNHYHLKTQFDSELLETFEKINEAMNTGNHDRSDTSTDYFDVGWYVSIHVGEWRKPFTITPKAAEAKVAA